jgi:photosystem II stability/assembly factor-like uncharacterized protein
MKKIIFYLLVLLFTGTASVYAQWEKIASYNVGVGRIEAHGSTVFLYGFQGEQFVYRSTDNGTSWINIASKFPNRITCVHSHGTYFFAAGIGFFYYSTDDGITWSVKSNTGFTGTIVSRLISDGTTLYALSDGARVFKSTDNGNAWSEIKVNHVNAIAAGNDFAASGNKMVFCINNIGSFISNDGGAKWILSDPSSYVAAVHAFNGDIYGSGFGMYKLVSDTVWQSITTGFPAGLGVTAGTRSTVSVGNKIFTYYYDIITQSAKIFASDNNGNGWYEVGNNLPPALASSPIDLLAATPEYLYYYNSNTTSVYRYPIQGTTAVEESNTDIPAEFSLGQNYPNPFNPSTVIKYQLVENSQVTLKVYDVLGKEVVTLVNSEQQTGTYSIDFDASHLSSGIYFYALSAGNVIQTKKMIVLK